MSNLEIKATELISASKKEKDRNAFLDTFIFEPENIEEQNLGNLYIVGEIANLSNNSEYLINLLVAIIKKEYYSLTGRSPIESFEQGLSKTNEMLADFAQQGNIEWIGNLNISVLVMKENTVYFSQTGKTQTLLVRGENIIDIGKDLIADPTPHPLKTFSNIASGEIEIGDKIILATPEFFRSIGEEEIKSAVAGNTEAVMEKFESLLGGKTSAALIFLEAVPSKPPTGISFKEISAGKAEGLKGDFGFGGAFGRPPVFDKEDRLKEIIDQINAREGEKPIDRKIKITAKALRFIAENTKKILLLVYRLIKKRLNAAYIYCKPKLFDLYRRLLEKIKNLASQTYNKLKSVSFFAAASEKLSASKNALWEKLRVITPPFLKNISRKNQIIVAGTLVFLVLAGGTAATLINKNREEQNIKYYGTLLEAAQKAEDEAEVAQIYQNDEKTKDLVRTVLNNTEKIIKSGYFVKEAEALKEKALGQMDKLEGIIRISAPNRIVNFGSNSDNIQTSGLPLLNKSLYSYNSQNNAIYRYNLTKKTSEIVAVSSQNIGHLKIAKTISDKIVFYTDLPAIAVYDPVKNELKNSAIKFGVDENDVIGLGGFGNNIYLLNKTDNEIYKHSAVLNGFADGIKWLAPLKTQFLTGLEEKEPLINPVSLAVDGNIYVLQNGDILKFQKGYKKEFSSPSTLIPFSGATKLFTAADEKNIYVLDPPNKRVLIISKAGKIVKQIVSEKFDDLIDLAVSPKEKELYLLNGTSVFEIIL